MKRLLIAIIAISSVISQASCIELYTQNITSKLNKRVLRRIENSQPIIYALGAAAVGAGLGSVAASMTYEETPAQQRTEWTLPKDVEVWNQAVADDDKQLARNNKYAFNGAFIGVASVVTAFASLGIRDLLISIDAKSYVKVLELVDQAQKGNGERFENLLAQIDRKGILVSEVQVSDEINRMFNEEVFSCPNNQPLKLKKFKELIINNLSYKH